MQSCYENAVYNSRLKFVLFSCLLIFLFGILSADPIISILQEDAIKIEPYYFHPDDNFFLIGEIAINNENNITLVINHHFWGNGRMTGRLLVFNSSYMLIGMYNMISDIPILDGNKLIFPFSEDTGNTIDFSHGIPTKIWIDGYVIDYNEVSRN